MKWFWICSIVFGCLGSSHAVPSVQEIRTEIADTRSYYEGEEETAFRLIDEYIREAAGDERLLRVIEDELIGVLESEASPACKQRICLRLQRVGTDASIPALRGLLLTGNPVLVDAACYALFANGSESARKALREVLPIVSGRNLRTVVTLLGELQDQDSTVSLIDLAAEADPQTKAAVFRALGELANTPAVEYLTGRLSSGDAEEMRLAGLALTEAAQNLEMTGHPEMAQTIFESLLAAQVPAFLRRGAFLGKIRAGNYLDTVQVIRAIEGEDPVLASAGISLIPDLEDPVATLKVAARIGGLPEPVKTAVIKALIRRGDKRAFTTLFALVSPEDEPALFVDMAVHLGDASVAPYLVAGLKEKKGDAARVFSTALERLEGEAVDVLLAGELEQSRGNFTGVCLNLIGSRGSNRAMPALMPMARQAGGSWVEASLRAMRTCGRVEDLPHLVQLLEIHAGRPDERHVREMLAVIAEKSSANRVPGVEVLGAMSQTAGKALSLELMHILGMVRNPAGLDWLVEVFDSTDAELREKAYESALRIARFSVSRGDENPEVRAALNKLSNKAQDEAVRKQALELLNRKPD